MDLSEALFTSLLALKTADSGSTGLTNSASTANCQRFILKDDPNNSPERSVYWPTIIVDVVENWQNQWSSSSADNLVCIVRMTVITKRDANRAVQNAINRRIAAVFDNATPAAQTGWTFGPIVSLRRQQASGNSTSYAFVHEFQIVASTGSNVPMPGTMAGVTFSGDEGTGFGTTYTGQVVSMTMQEAESVDVAEWYDFGDRSIPDGLSGRCEVVFAAASAVPIVPTGTNATIVVYTNTAGSKRWTATARVASLEYNASGANLQQVRMVFVLTTIGLAQTNLVTGS